MFAGVFPQSQSQSKIECSIEERVYVCVCVCVCVSVFECVLPIGWRFCSLDVLRLWKEGLQLKSSPAEKQ